MVCSVVFLALPLAVQATFTPTDTPALQAALVNWCSNSTAARADYGPSMQTLWLGTQRLQVVKVPALTRVGPHFGQSESGTLAC